MKQSIMLTKDDPQLSEFSKELIGVDKRMEERMTFIEKQLETASKSCQEESQAVWTKIQNRLIELGKIPANYDREKECLSLNKKTGLLEIEPHGEHSSDQKKAMLGKAILGSILGSLTNPGGPTVH